MDLDAIDAKPNSSPGGRREGLAYANQARCVERSWCRLAFSVRDCGWCTREPATLGDRDQRAAFPWNPARPFASSMRQLVHHGDARVLADRGQDRLERSLSSVVPQPKIARSDTALRLYRGSFDAQDPRPRHGEIAQMNQVPRVGQAVLRPVLAHRR